MKNTIKNTMIAAVILSTVCAGFVGCKKGENDPFLSFRSRKGRVAGDWTVSAYKETQTQGSNTTTTNYDGTTWTETDPTGSPSTVTKTVTYTAKFEKDGKWSSNMHATWSETIFSITTTYDETETSSGTWNFTGGVGEEKNKSQLAMFTESYSDVKITTVASNPPSTNTSSSTATGSLAWPNVMDIDQLKNKEMILMWKGTDSGPTSVDGSMTLTQ